MATSRNVGCFLRPFVRLLLSQLYDSLYKAPPICLVLKPALATEETFFHQRTNCSCFPLWSLSSGLDKKGGKKFN